MSGPQPYDPGPYDSEERAERQWLEAAVGLPGDSTAANHLVILKGSRLAGLELTDYEHHALQAIAMDAAGRPAIAQVLAGLLVRAARPTPAPGAAPPSPRPDPGG